MQANTLQRLATAAAVAAATLALTATANASTWSSSTGQVQGAGSLTLTDGATSTNCNVTVDASVTFGGLALAGNDDYKLVAGTCTPVGYAHVFNVYALLFADDLISTTGSGYAESPFGTFDPAIEAEIVPAAAGQPTKLAFDHTYLGTTPNGDIHATGNINLNNGAGGNITVNP